MLTEKEKRQILLAEFLQREAEDRFWMKQSKKATARTAQIMREEEVNEDENP